MAISTIIINGVAMPFGKEKLLKVLNIIKRSISKAAEEFAHDEEKRALHDLIHQLESM